MFLAAMQRCLEEFYGLDVPYDVNDFVITDRNLAGALGGGRRRVDEELLIAGQPDDLSVALFLEEALVARLTENDPTRALTQLNIADFLTAFEGVSHFVYFAFKAGAGRSVTLLELELQAEVDKFVVTSLYLQRQGERVPAGLHRWLFDMPRLDAALSADEYERYERANHYAARYCRKLGQLERSHDLVTAQRELRSFYRMPREEKIGRIEAA
jgi:hypothetical protein